MTAITPRVVLGRIGERTERVRARRARVALPRPPAYVVLCSTVVVLNVIGLVMILSASSVAALSNYGSSWYFFNRQLAWSLFGALAFLVTARVDYHRWRRLTPLVLVITLVVLFVVLVPGIGIVVDGSRRWLGYGSLRFQPSEIAKFALLLFGADVLTRRSGPAPAITTVRSEPSATKSPVPRQPDVKRPRNRYWRARMATCVIAGRPTPSPRAAPVRGSTASTRPPVARNSHLLSGDQTRFVPKPSAPRSTASA